MTSMARARGREAGRGVQKARQYLAIGQKRSAPQTNRALFQREKARDERQILLAAEQERLRLSHARRDGVEPVRPTTLGDWARRFERNSEEWLTLPPVAPPWPNQVELIPRLLECCTIACPDGGGKGAILREPMGSGKTRLLFEFLLEDARQRVRGNGARFGPGCATLILVPKTLLGQWEDQWLRWMTAARLAVVFLPVGQGPEAILEADIDSLYHCVDAIVMTYETLTSAMRATEKTGLLAVQWRHLVVEEGTTLGHEDTHFFDACSQLRTTGGRILISAEPLLNARTRELNGVLSFLGSSVRLPLALDEPLRDDPAIVAAKARRVALLAHFDARAEQTTGLPRQFDSKRAPTPPLGYP